jgi:mono/diheme cytochrome c family protein
MKRWCIGLGVLVIAATLAIVALLVRGGISARPAPSPFEAAVATAVRSWLIPAAARRAGNPVPPTVESFRAGRAHFADHCASCHANDGSGQTALGRGLYPRAPDMRRRDTQDLSDGELFYIIENGVRFTGMPAFGGAGEPDETWQLVHFIRRLPDLTPGDISEMERLNPRTAAEWQEMADDEAFLEGSEPPARAGPGARSH